MKNPLVKKFPGVYAFPKSAKHVSRKARGLRQPDTSRLVNSLEKTLDLATQHTENLDEWMNSLDAEGDGAEAAAKLPLERELVRAVRAALESEARSQVGAAIALAEEVLDALTEARNVLP